MSAPIKLLITLPFESLAKRASGVPGYSIAVATERSAVLREIADAEVACVADFDAELLATAQRLRWVQAFLGGVERVLFPQLVASTVPLTCVKETFGAPGAEHALATILAVSYRLDYYLRQQSRRTFVWEPAREPRGQTLGILGFGNIGRALAVRAKVCEMRVIAMARNADAPAAPADKLVGPSQLPYLLAESDFVVVAVPSTAQTRGMIGTREVGQMKPSAWLIDISGRPAIVDQPAVIEALRQRRIAGADLQFAKPPPADSPVWEMDNLIMSQFSANSHEETERSLDLVVDNLRRYRDGEPLRGLVDKAEGY